MEPAISMFSPGSALEPVVRSLGTAPNWDNHVTESYSLFLEGVLQRASSSANRETLAEAVVELSWDLPDNQGSAAVTA